MAGFAGVRSESMSDLMRSERVPTGENSVIRLHPSDNVPSARVAFGAIPAGHKIAVRDIPAVEPVIRYGCVIGTASATIEAGSHVHTHNLAFLPGSDLTASPQNER